MTIQQEHFNIDRQTHKRSIKRANIQADKYANESITKKYNKYTHIQDTNNNIINEQVITQADKEASCQANKRANEQANEQRNQITS